MIYSYMYDLFLYIRTITVGKVLIGSDHPVAKQTMATTVTKDVEASVAQVRTYTIFVSDLYF
jgi:4-hydroxy-3-methylbut-2-en-1-yl diphosphate synthase IspG/GcpE